MSSNLKILLPNLFNWGVVAFVWNMSGLASILTMGALIAAMVVSILTAIKLRSDYKVNKAKKHNLELDRQIKDQQLAREILKNKESISIKQSIS